MNEIVIGNDLHFSMGKKTIRITAFFILMVWCLGFTFSSLFPGSSIIILYPLLKQFYSTVCHQITYKSIDVNGIHFLVCARCTGIYFGGLFASTVFLFYSKGYTLKVKYFFISAVPMLIDIMLYSSGVYQYSIIIALITGLIFGATCLIFILNSIENYLLKENVKE